MKKLIIATAAILAATLASGSAFAIPGGATKTLQAPAAAVKVNCGRHHRAHRRHHHTHCCGSNTPAAAMAAVAGPMEAAAAFLAVVLAGKSVSWGGAIPPR